jgi:hypothetical protein
MEAELSIEPQDCWIVEGPDSHRVQAREEQCAYRKARDELVTAVVARISESHKAGLPSTGSFHLSLIVFVNIQTTVRQSSLCLW